MRPARKTKQAKKNHRVTVGLSAETHQALSDLASQRNASLAQVAREAVIDYLTSGRTRVAPGKRSSK